MGIRQARLFPGMAATGGLRISLLGALLTLFALLAGGCTVAGFGADSPATATPPPSTPTPSPAAAGAGWPADLAESVALLRPRGEPDEILGSAVVMSSEGLLVTSLDVVSGDVEAVLPNGEVYRPALVSVEPDVNLALLKVPASRLVPARLSTERLAEGAEVFATGYDGTPGSIGRMSGTVVRTVENDESVDYRTRGASWIDTDINLVDGFVGGPLSDGDGGFTGILVPAEDAEGNATVRAVSNWVVLSWLESRENHIAALEEESASWESVELPGGWSVRQPHGWSLDVSTDEPGSFNADLLPSDPDASLQLSISVEPNEFGTDPGPFVRDMVEDRDNARLWGVSSVDGNALVRLTVAQEGALIDVVYLLGSDYMVTISMTSGYQPADAPAQSDEARALFQTVVDSLSS